MSAGHEPIWAPAPDDVAAASVPRFARRLTRDGRARLTGGYLELWRWPAERLEEFWPAVWDYFGVRSATPHERVLSGSVMPDVQWFPGAQVSYVEHLFRGRDPERVALIDARESARPGVGPVSRRLATASLGAIWYEIAGALVVGVERPGGECWMPLFVVLNPGYELDGALTGKIGRAVREGASPRHVPDEIIAAPAIPHTRTGKKLEIPVKRILQGGDPRQVMDAGAADPDALRWFAGWHAEART